MTTDTIEKPDRRNNPIEWFPEPESIDLAELLQTRGNTYALRIKGDGFSNYGLADGDYVVIERNDRPSPGSLVVAEVDCSSTVIARCRWKPRGFVELDGRMWEERRVKVLGKMVGAVRK